MSDRLPGFRLGIIAGDRCARDNSGRVMVNHAIGRLMETIRAQVPSSRLCLPILRKLPSNMVHALDFPDDAIVPLPPMRNTLSAQRYYLQTRRVLRRFVESVDLLLMRLPFQLPVCLQGLGKPKVLHVVGNPLEVVRVSTDYRGPAKALAVWFARHSNESMRRLVAEPNTRAVTHGRELWKLLGCREGHVIVSSAIYEREMRPRADMRLGQPPRLLFVGYLRSEKGVDTLLEAFGRLRRERELKLTLAGGADRETNAERLIRQKIANHLYKNDIEMTGMVDFGEPLFNLYRQHDVYVLPSLSEGTPRTLVEARGFGCPVVATRVGGIPTSVTDGVDGLLVEPSNPEELASAIRRILDDEPLRHRLIDAGLHSARAFTVERFAGGLLDELEILADSIRQRAV